MSSSGPLSAVNLRPETVLLLGGSEIPVVKIVIILHKILEG